MGQSGQCRHKRLKLIKHLVIQPFFTRQRTFLGAQGLVFKGLEFRGHETLGVFQSLAAAVVSGHFVKLALADFNKKTMNLVVLHPQIGNAGACLFAGFHLKQKAVAVGLDGAKFVKLCIKTIGNHTTITHSSGRLVSDGTF